MAIDNCKHSFNELSKKVLPGYMAEIKKEIASPVSMSEFSKKGVGKATALKNLNLQKDFSGCYVLIEAKRPIYVGISRSVISRLLQHVKGTTHFDASLAYRIANHGIQHNLSRTNAMKTDAFKKRFKKAKERISKMNVVYVKIENDLEIYLFEAYCAMELDTKKWNTFATH
ncbi:MAG: excinuclease ABC subunit C [Candidatus Scalindua sp.]